MGKNKLNEEAIIKRLSNGDLSVLYGGNAQNGCSIPSDSTLIKNGNGGDTIRVPAHPACPCLAGCLPTDHRACSKCIV